MVVAAAAFLGTVMVLVALVAVDWRLAVFAAGAGLVWVAVNTEV